MYIYIILNFNCQNIMSFNLLFLYIYYYIFLIFYIQIHIYTIILHIKDAQTHTHVYCITICILYNCMYKYYICICYRGSFMNIGHISTICQKCINYICSYNPSSERITVSILFHYIFLFFSPLLS